MATTTGEANRSLKGEVINTTTNAHHHNYGLLTMERAFGICTQSKGKGPTGAAHYMNISAHNTTHIRDRGYRRTPGAYLARPAQDDWRPHTKQPPSRREEKRRRSHGEKKRPQEENSRVLQTLEDAEGRGKRTRSRREKEESGKRRRNEARDRNDGICHQSFNPKKKKKENRRRESSEGWQAQRAIPPVKKRRREKKEGIKEEKERRRDWKRKEKGERERDQSSNVREEQKKQV